MPAEPSVTGTGRVGVAHSAAWYRDCYGSEPAGGWFAPGRVNLIGEHTDYNEGFVLPFALSRGALVMAAARRDGLLQMRSRQIRARPVTIPLNSLAPGKPSGWAAYPAGIAWALRAAGHFPRGANLVIDSDVPRGAGLSSSAALECAVALALDAIYELKVPRPELAAVARRAENEFAGVPSGIMDQSASLLCEPGHALLLDCRSGESSQIPFDTASAGLELLVIDTSARHKLTDGNYASRRDECAAAAAALGVRSLRDITDPAALARLADPVLRRRATHIVTENRRVLDTVGLLRSGQLGAIGPLLTASHTSLRDDFEISWPEADTAVEAAISAGALGGRMIGGGFGGSVIALAPVSSCGRIRSAVRDSFARAGFAPPHSLGAVPSAGGRRVA
jgi:galactokinase